ncbi:MAG: TolC family protein [Myxococcales bacterium]|nr:TolC family protein [Myxococcales bacterium]MCB9754992.1 TolC family protein [Myxococcales bacterium]
MLPLHPLLLLVTFAGPPDTPCSGPLTREAVIACATQQSPRVRADEARVAAARGEADAARVLLPTNPNVAITVGQRWNTLGDRAVNVSGTLSQRLEIAGERRKRAAVADAEIDARARAAEVTERDVIADALLAYYDVLAVREEVTIVARGLATAERLRGVAEARAAAGLGAPLASELAAAEVARFVEHVALARGRVRVAESRLAVALGLDPTAPPPEVRGSLTPLATSDDVDDALRVASTRPELERARAEKRAREAQLALSRRERAPAPSLSFFVQTDGFNERVIGGGLSLPILLPHPLGRTNKGEIAAARARVREADERVAAAARVLSVEATTAYHEYAARREAAGAYSAHADASARRSLDALADEIERGRLPVRDALLTQQSLIDLLLRSTRSRHQLCLASVTLVLASGARFDGGAS